METKELSYEVTIPGEKFNVSTKANPSTTTLAELLKQVGIDPEKKNFVISQGTKTIYKKSGFLFNQLDLTKTLLELSTRNELNFRPRMTKMFFPTSGKSGFSFYEGNPNLIGKRFERGVLAKMYHRENELRLSDSVQEEMDKCTTEDDDDTYAELLDNLQRKVLKGEKL